MATDDLSIKVTIGNRVYPLTIKRDEEELIRKATKLVNENIKELEQNYAVRDRQDLLAMTALFYANRFLETERQLNNRHSSQNHTLQQLDARLSEFMESL